MSAAASIAVVAVFELLLVASPVVVAVAATGPVLGTPAPSATEEATVTWIVNVVVAPTVRLTARLQVTTLAAAVQSVLGWNVRPVARVSVTVISPTWTDGPLLVTIRV